MLTHLYIKNFTLIDELDIDFHPGFSVITGETGAGKSIILGAIGLLLGQRADSKAIKKGEKKCVIEAHFDLSNYGMEAFFDEHDIEYEPQDCILRRELMASGKSRAFINDSPASLQQMKALGERLIDIHSQHQNLLLQQEDFQLNVLDIIADDATQLHDYQDGYRQFKAVERQLQKLKEQIEEAKANQDFMQFQYHELEEAKLEDGQQEDLEQELQKLSHAEDIKTALYNADNLLNEDENGIVEKLKRASDSLHDITEVYPEIKEAAQRLESVHIELKDIAQDIAAQTEDVDFDPQRLDEVNNQLDKIYSLQQKFHVSTVRELIELRDDLKNKLNTITNSDEEVALLQQKLAQAQRNCEAKAAKLSDMRGKAGKLLASEMKQRLIPLGMPNVRFEARIEAKPLSENGRDKIQFYFSANKSTEMQPVAQIASGGEIARVMLSLKAMISGVVKLPTIIFDEIDTGVSGKIAQKMAIIMQEMGSKGRQVISITHLPQIAALGQYHYKVEKHETPTGTQSNMRELNEEQRVDEIAQMLSGDNVTDAARNNARELLSSRGE